MADLLNRGLIPYRNQSLLKNGKQTAGNIFSLDDSRINELEKIIRYEVDAYKNGLGNQQDGITRKWPSNYSLFGWIVRFFDGGELDPHIHERGWVSGSIYLQVPKHLDKQL